MRTSSPSATPSRFRTSFDSILQDFNLLSLSVHRRYVDTRIFVTPGIEAKVPCNALHFSRIQGCRGECHRNAKKDIMKVYNYQMVNQDIVRQHIHERIQGTEDLSGLIVFCLSFQLVEFLLQVLDAFTDLNIRIAL